MIQRNVLPPSSGLKSNPRKQPASIFLLCYQITHIHILIKYIIEIWLKYVYVWPGDDLLNVKTFSQNTACDLLKELYTRIYCV
jgi:hypothetical protein